MSDRTKLLLLFAVQGIVCLAVLAALELAVRWRISLIPPAAVPSGLAHPPYFNTPGVTTSPKAFGYHVKHRINALGLRGPETRVEKGAARRILLLGDSVVFGALVKDEDTLAVQLQRLLDGGGWEVLNAAVGGYDAWDYEGFLKAKGFEFKPDIVVVGLYRNDHIGHDVYVQTLSKTSPPNRPLMAALRDLLFRSELVNSLNYFLQRRQNAKRPRLAVSKPLKPADDAALAAAFPGDPQTVDALKAYLRDYKYDPSLVKDTLTWMLDLKSWKAVRAPLALMRDACRKRGIRLLVLIFPVQFELYYGYQWPEPERTIESLLKSLGIPFVDLRPVLASGRGDEHYRIRYDYAHPDAEAYGLVATGLLRKLLELGWL
ncbi:MAG: hypothetical protein HY922_13500 [Elusimicrobia bacterium]|nr:hypothetical protein [Elusimicrobiota bacterium]